MKLMPRLILLTSMILIGLTYGLLYHYMFMPLFGSELLHCIASGTIFGLINYFVSIKVYKKFHKLEEINNNLKKSINIDKLSSLLNRRALDNDIKSIPKNETYSLIFIDIDNFRKFNNEFGHKTGDIVLQKVAQTIINNIRCDDKAYRYGGEEFVILLKDCDKNNSFKIAEKIRINISKIDNSPFPPITISLGVASYPEDGTNFSEIAEASDMALLQAKKSGKNCTLIYSHN